jgi:hypothetical protein
MTTLVELTEVSKTYDGAVFPARRAARSRAAAILRSE